ncbi:MAG: aldo/keto reductase [Candidatus Thorarchaeota archaeon]|jgi:aryl-alcohol dehydrogenase-like predicted oxidoreductase
MKKRILGKSGIKVSAMGMGCWGIGGAFLHPEHGPIAYGLVEDEESIKTVQLAVDMGITLFDTANVYGCGRSERVLGEALKGRREDIVIATKFASTFDMNSGNPNIPCQATGSDTSAQGIKDACNASLERLQTDYIDLYQLHSGSLDLEQAPAVMESLEELVEEGKIRYYGWSTDSPERAALFAKGKHCASVQFRHNMTSHNYDMIENVLDKFDIAGLVKGPLGYGVLTGKYKADSQVPEEHMFHGTKFNEGPYAIVRDTLEILKEVVTADGRTQAQAALGWIWAEHDSLIPIPGSKTQKQIQENASALKFGPLSKKQMHEVKKIVDEMREKIKKQQS